MTFTNYEEFCGRVGLINSLEELESFGAPKPEHDNGMYETTCEQREALNEFLETHPNFHVATLVDDCENFSIIENRPRLVNRIGFYLCNGDKDQNLILEEGEKQYV